MDKIIAIIAGEISSKRFKMVVLKYRMKVHKSALENIDTAERGNEEKVIREVLTKWRRMTNANEQVSVCTSWKKRK